MADENVCKVCKFRRPMTDWDPLVWPSSGLCYVCYWNKCQHCGMVLEEHGEDYKCIYDSTYFEPEHDRK